MHEITLKYFDYGYKKPLKEVKSDEFFILSANSKKVYVKAEYDRSERAYWCDEYEDICEGKYIKGNKLVIVGFTY